MLQKFLSFFLVLASMTQFVYADFRDTESSWYRESITKLTNEKIISGYGDGTFGPERTITRAEILKIILQASGNGLGEVPLDRCFPDVSEKMWYHGYICRAFALRVTNGFSDGTFKPDNPVTVLEALAFGFRAFSIETPLAGSGQSWHDPMRQLADEKNILPINSYTLSTPISRGRATELITHIRDYKHTGNILEYGTHGCQKGRDLLKKNMITVQGKSREYLLTVPRGYLKVKKYPLIVAIHGRTNSHEQVQGYMGLDKTSDFIVAYPLGLDGSDGGRSWSEGENIEFFDRMILEIADAYCVDRSEVHLVGHSLGGWFAQKLVCLRGDVVRSVTAVGSAGYSGNCTGPAVSLIYQNPDDALSPYSVGVSGREIRKKVNECSDTTTDVRIGALTCKQSVNCSTGNPVIWCEGYPTYGDDPHSWPKSGGEQILGFLRGL